MFWPFVCQHPGQYGGKNNHQNKISQEKQYEQSEQNAQPSFNTQFFFLIAEINMEYDQCNACEDQAFFMNAASPIQKRGNKND